VTSRRALSAVFISGLFLSACGSGAAARTSTSTSTPSQVALKWFKAIDTHNVLAADRLFAPSQVGEIAWMKQPAKDQSKFTVVRCHTTVVTSQRAAVLCTFTESASPTEGDPVTFWSISFQRGAMNQWLINNYGQG
jgi:hypothetical protein